MLDSRVQSSRETSFETAEYSSKGTLASRAVYSVARKYRTRLTTVQLKKSCWRAEYKTARKYRTGKLRTVCDVEISLWVAHYYSVRNWNIPYWIADCRLVGKRRNRER